mgnify:FL=1
MKKLRLLYTIICAAGIALTSVSCKDYLDKAPGSDIDPADPYKNYTNFQGFMEEAYNCIPALASISWYHGCWNYGEDEYWQPSETRMLTNAIDQGNYWAWNTVQYSPFHTGHGGTTGTNRDNKGCLWGNCWYGIYKVNLGLNNLNLLTDATQEEKNIIAGQLYFFRAFFHFQIMQYWGGIPYIDFLIPSDAVFNYPRLSYQECADKVAADFQKAVDLLPVDWDKTTVGKQTLGKNKLRINKIMALAFLGKNYLYAGSPLMNKVSAGDANYNKEYCKKAAEAFGQVLKLCKESGLYELADFDHYMDIFYTYDQGTKLPGMKEVIFYENTSNTSWCWNQVCDYRPSCLIASGIKVYPTANYVDYFGMANGKPIKDITKKDADSGYDPEYPFKNRDPRFYELFIYDGVKCVKNATKAQKGPEQQYASLYTGGMYRKATPSKDCFTGYLLKKFCDPYRNDHDEGDAKKKAIRVNLGMIRLADVYLMYAESVAQGYGDINASSSAYKLSAVDAVNIIRNRAHVDNIAAEYLTSMDGFMSELRRERAVELAFEGHRFNDLRRWLLIDKAPYTQKTAVYFDRAADQKDEARYDEPKNNHVLNLREEPLITRQFTEKHYWFPFLRDDVQMYPEFNQNPGWE